VNELRLVLLLATVLQIGSMLLFRARIAPTGDEPHYLIVTQSLVRDRDLDLANQYATGQYRDFVAELEPRNHAFDFHGDGRLFHIRPPGQSLLLAPGYALGNLGRRTLPWLPEWTPYAGAVGTLLVIAIGLTVALQRLIRHAGGGAGTSIVAILLIAGTLPVVPYGTQIYPEFSAALLVVGVLGAMLVSRPGRWMNLSVGLCVGALPWLHQRNLLLAAVLVLGYLWARARVPRPRADAAWLLGPPILSAIGLTIYSLHTYGSALVTDGYAPLGTISSWSNLTRGLTLLLLDDGRGLLTYAPQTVVILIVWIAACRETGGALRRVLIVALACLVVTALGSASTFGPGHDIPPRHVVTGLILGAIPLALALGRTVPIVRWLLVLSFVPGAIVTGYAAALPGRLFDSDLGNRALADMGRDLYRVAGVTVPLNQFFPSLLGTETTLPAARCRDAGSGAVLCQTEGALPIGRYTALAAVSTIGGDEPAPARLEVMRIDRDGCEAALAAAELTPDALPDVLPLIVTLNPPAPDDPRLIAIAVSRTDLPPEIVAAVYRAGHTYYRAHGRPLSPGQIDILVRELEGASSVRPGVGLALLRAYAAAVSSAVHGTIDVTFDRRDYGEIVFRIAPTDRPIAVGGILLKRHPRATA